MKKHRVLIFTLIITNVLTAVVACSIYFSAILGKSKLDEESHHLYLRAENYKSFILKENKRLSPKELLIKYNNPRELTEYERKANIVELDLLYFQFKDEEIIGIE